MLWTAVSLENANRDRCHFLRSCLLRTQDNVQRMCVCNILYLLYSIYFIECIDIFYMYTILLYVIIVAWYVYCTIQNMHVCVYVCMYVNTVCVYRYMFIHTHSAYYYCICNIYYSINYIYIYVIYHTFIVLNNTSY